MSRALLGAAVGAGGATAYYSLPDLQGQLRAILSAPARPGPVSAGDVEGLQRMVEQLAREIRRGQGVTIVHGSSGGGHSQALLTTTGAALLAAAVYARLRGWSVGDLMYVTRGSLRHMERQVADGLDALGKRVAGVREYLLGQLRALGAKQDAALDAQGALAAQLGDVGADVEGTRGRVEQVHEAVQALEASLGSLGANLQYANQGIYVLCKVVGELLHGKPPATGRGAGAARELEEYIRHPPATLPKPPVAGLESVLRDLAADADTGAARRVGSGFMLSGGAAAASPLAAPRLSGASSLPTPAAAGSSG